MPDAALIIKTEKNDKNKQDNPVYYYFNPVNVKRTIILF